jgi:parafibromin
MCSKLLLPLNVAGMTAMLTLFNTKQFLEEGRFEPSQVAQQRGVTKHPLLVINRTALRPGVKGGGVPYHVMDKPPIKGHPDWQRVVAVVAQGAKWQFKDWPFKVSRTACTGCSLCAWKL